MIALHEAGLAPAQISGLISAVADALIRRALELAEARFEAPTPDFAWLALGSHARREAVPSSDLDSGHRVGRLERRDVPQTLARETLETLPTTA